MPLSMTLMGGPIDTRENPTVVNKLAEERGIEWFRRHVITKVPFPHPGFMRDVYPGFLQLNGFMTMNLDRHIEAHRNLFRHLVEGDGDFADEAPRVLRRVSRRHGPLGRVLSADRRDGVHPPRPAEGRDDPSRQAGRSVARSAASRCSPSRASTTTFPASGRPRPRTSCARTFPDDKKAHYLQLGVGHYGVFNGSRFRSEIAPRISDFILSHNGRGKGAKRKVLAEA